MRENLGEPFFAEGRKLSVTASIGIAARAPGEDPPLDRLLCEADAAMYRAKKKGKTSQEPSEGPDGREPDDQAR